MHEHFFVVGAQRSGTTYLARLLDDHPEIQMAMPERPEPKFFLDDSQFGRGLNEYERRYFDPAGPGLHGEKSTSYIESEVAADRIAVAFPDAAIIAVLRDPVARAVSNYRLTRESGLETRPIDLALGTDDRAPPRSGNWFVVDGRLISASPFAYRARGRYAEQLAAYAGRFRRLRVLLYETLVGDAATVAGLYSFLGVDPGHEPAGLGEVVRPSRGDQEPLSTAVADELRRWFAPHNARLEAEYGVDVSRWSR